MMRDNTAYRRRSAQSACCAACAAAETAEDMLIEGGEAETGLHSCLPGEGPPAALPDPEGRGLHPLVYRGTSLRRSRNPTVGDAQILLNNFLNRLDPGFSSCTFARAGDAARARRYLDALRAAGQLPLIVDCRFGPNTDRATRIFQLCKGVTEDGKIGPVTWPLLEAFRSSPAPPPQPRPVVPPASRTATVTVTLKSVILPIGRRVGVIARCPLRGLRLQAFALATQSAVSDSCESDEKDKAYRLFSQRRFEIEHDGARIINVSQSSLDTDVGRECIPGTSRCLDPPPMVVMSQTLARAGAAEFTFSWRAKGRPHAAAEPGFQVVCPRTSVFIWHRVNGRITLSGGRVRVAANLSGSRFPTHCAFIGGRRTAFIRQGVFANLWTAESFRNPTLVL